MLWRLRDAAEGRSALLQVDLTAEAGLTGT